MSGSDVTISIVDDDALVLASLAGLVKRFGYRVKAFRTPVACLADYDAATPGCHLLDLAMPELDGISLFVALSEMHPPPTVVFLSGQADIPRSVQAMKLGASDFLTKPVDANTLKVALAAAVERDARNRQECLARDEQHSHLARLTPREREVLVHILSGQLNKQIAWDLGISENTVKIHRSHIMEKMEARSVLDLAGYAASIADARSDGIRATSQVLPRSDAR